MTKLDNVNTVRISRNNDDSYDVQIVGTAKGNNEPIVFKMKLTDLDYTLNVNRMMDHIICDGRTLPGLPRIQRVSMLISGEMQDACEWRRVKENLGSPDNLND